MPIFSTNRTTTKKAYFLDTSVIIHDPKSLLSFQENDVILAFTTISEIDHLRKANNGRGRSAREAIRIIEKLREKNNEFFNAELPGGGTLMIIDANESDMALMRDEKINNDDVIIKTIRKFIKKNKNKYSKIILVSKDSGMRIKASCYGITAEDYTTDKIPEVFNSYTGKYDKNIEIEREEFDKLKETKKIDLPEELHDMIENQYIVVKLKDHKISVLARRTGNYLKKIADNLELYSKITGKNMEQCMAIDLLLDPDVHLVALTGASGTGKTLLSLAAGLYQLARTGTNSEYDKILCIKPIVPIGKDIGFLPGAKEEKLFSWLAPFIDNLQFIGGYNFPDTLIDKGSLELEAMTYMRGRSIPNTWIIIDECLTEDHLVWTADGKAIPIKNIKNNDKITSINICEKTINKNNVSNCFSRQTRTILKIKTSRGTIKCTPTHKLWINSENNKLEKKEARHISLTEKLPALSNMPHIATNDLGIEQGKILAQEVCLNEHELPEEIWNAPLETIKYFILECFNQLSLVEESITIASNNVLFLKQLQCLLLKFGIESCIDDTLRIINCRKFYNIIGFTNKEKYGKVANKGKVEENEFVFLDILEISEEENEVQVYDFTVENDHTFIIDGGLITSNCQNLTPAETKTALTRTGHGSKVIILADTSQIDTNYLNKESCGITHIINAFKNNPIFGVVEMVRSERSKLAAVAAKVL